MGMEGPPKEISHIPDELAHKVGLRPTLRQIERTNFSNISSESYEKARSGLEALLINAKELYLSLHSNFQRLRPGDPQYKIVNEMMQLAGRFQGDMADFVYFCKDLVDNPPADPDTDMRLASVGKLRELLTESQHKLEQFPVQGYWSRWRLKRVAKQLAMSTALMLASGLHDSGLHQAYQRTIDKPKVTKSEQAKPLQKKQIKKQEISKKIEEKTSGSPEDKKGKNPEQLAPKSKERLRANMNGDGEAGKLEKGVPVARIEFSNGSCITDPLWITQLYNGDEPVNRQHFGIVGQTIEASVTTETINAFEGQEIVLPTPLGFRVAAVFSESGADFTYDKYHTSAIKFSGSGESVIRYEVEQVPDCLQAVHSEAAPEVSTQIGEAALEKLKNNPDASDVRQVLKDYFGNFTYVVSSDAQDIVDKLSSLGFSEYEVIEALKVGDCDVLSKHAAELLNKADIRAATAVGYLETDGSLYSERMHAKLVFSVEAGDEGKTELVEVTSLTKRSLVNVILAEDDKQALQNTMSGVETLVKDNNFIKAREVLSQMGSELQQILDHSGYKKFESKTDDISGESGARDLENIWRSIRRSFFETMRSSRSVSTFENIAWSLAFLAALIGLIYLTLKSRSKAQEALDARLRAGVWKEFLELDAFAKAGELSGDNEGSTFEDQLNERLKNIYQYSPEFAKVLPIEKLLTMGKGQRLQGLRVLLAVRHILGERRDCLDFGNNFFSPMLAIAETDLIRARNRLAADGIDLDEPFRILRDLTKNPEFIADAQKQLEVQMQKIFVVAKQALGKMEKISAGDPQRRLRQIFAEIGLETNRSGGEGGPGRKPPRVGTGMEFYDLVPYEPGMDATGIDQYAYARTGKLYVRRNEENTKKQPPTQLFDAIINVETAHNDEIAYLAAAMLYGQRHPETLSFSSITIIAHGEAIERFEKAGVQALMSISDGPAKVQAFLKRLAKARAESVIGIGEKFGDQAIHIRGGNQKFLGDSVPFELRSILPKITGNVLFVGHSSVYSGNKDDKGRQFYNFSVGQQPGEEDEVLEKEILS